MQKKEYINLANDVLKQMNKATEDLKQEFKKPPLIQLPNLRTWFSRAIILLLAGSYIYYEVWPALTKKKK